MTQDGVCTAINDKTAHHVAALYDNRPQANLEIETEQYDLLPGLLAKQDFIWRIRAADVNIVLNRLGDKSQHVLEIGAWNGWLSHHIVKAGHQLTALGYSAHPVNGLGAKTHYSVDWHAIQTDLSNLDILNERGFDAVIINHGLHYFTDPVGYIESVKRFIKPGGQIILLNVIVYRDPSARIAQIQAQRIPFEAEHNVPYFLHPTRGYLDQSDQRHLEDMGVKLRPYRHLWRAYLKSRFIKKAPAYYFGIHRR